MCLAPDLLYCSSYLWKRLESAGYMAWTDSQQTSNACLVTDQEYSGEFVGHILVHYFYWLYRRISTSFLLYIHIFLDTLWHLFQSIFAFSILGYEEMISGDYAYPEWSINVGWVLTASSISCIPAYIIYLLYKTPGPFLHVSINT